jgi:hypothetical protein
MFNFNLLPSPADNIYRGSKAALWFFIAFVCLMTCRSIIHMFFEEYRAHDLATIIVFTGYPDPMPLMYIFFSLWLFAQLIFCGICWIVIFRYRSLISLMYVFWLIDWSGRLFLYPLIERNTLATGIYTTGNTPGVEGAPYATLLLVIFLLLSIREKT